MPSGERTTRSAAASCSASSNAVARASSLIAEARGMSEHPELCDVAAEEERDGPVDDDAELPRQERQLVQVIRPRHEPAEEPAQPQAEDVGDPLVPPQRRYLPEHAVTVGLRRAAEGLPKPPPPAPPLAENPQGTPKP